MREPTSLAPPAVMGALRFKSFQELGQHLERMGEFERLNYSHLEFGACYWIPDEETGFGKGGLHPWIVTMPYQGDRPTIAACPRTTSPQWQPGRNDLHMPGGVVRKLGKDGVILLGHRRPFPAADFRHYEYIGLLPEEWQRKLREALAAEARDIAKESAKP